jgi:hypothetical protein
MALEAGDEDVELASEGEQADVDQSDTGLDDRGKRGVVLAHQVYSYFEVADQAKTRALV